MSAVARRTRLPTDVDERAKFLADQIDDLDGNVSSQLATIRAELKEARGEVQKIGSEVTNRLRWVTLSLFSVTGIVFTAILTYVVAGR